MAQLLMCILDMDRQTHSSNWYQRETETIMRSSGHTR